MRELLIELYLFRQSLREAELWAELFTDPRSCRRSAFTLSSSLRASADKAASILRGTNSCMRRSAAR